ncbi:MAG: AraC family transcriptional regulator, partial [Saprospiraceae bacterium]
QKERFYKIRKLLQDAARGIKFHGKTFEAAMQKMIGLTEDKGFASIVEFLQLLDLLSQSTETTFLASEGFSPQALSSENNRIQLVYSYILKNFANYHIKIGEVAALVNMTSSAFSHFFQKYTTKSFTQFLLDVRIGHACKLLLSTDESINQICYGSGFNNMANFNRLFKKYRGCTPLAYRRRHKEKNDFDWTKQITPWQFMPPKAGQQGAIKPVQYATKLMHL